MHKLALLQGAILPYLAVMMQEPQLGFYGITCWSHQIAHHGCLQLVIVCLNNVYPWVLEISVLQMTFGICTLNEARHGGGIIPSASGLQESTPLVAPIARQNKKSKSSCALSKCLCNLKVDCRY